MMALSRNSPKIACSGLPTMLASTLSRPRWAMPMTTFRTPCPTARSTRNSSSATKPSAPSTLKRFAPRNLVAEELLQALRLDDLPQEELLHLGRQREPVAGPLHPLLEPAAQILVVHVRELDADRPAVGLLEARDQIAERPIAPPLGVGGGPVEVGGGEAEALERERLGGPDQPERIEVGAEVSVLAVGLHQPVDPGLEGGVAARGGPGRGGRRRPGDGARRPRAPGPRPGRRGSASKYLLHASSTALGSASHA